MIKIAIQTNAWSSDLHRDAFPQMLADIAAAGYQGIEIGAHRINLDDPHGFRSLLDRFGLAPAGIHTHAALWQADALDEAAPRVRQAAAFAHAVGSAYVLISGKPNPAKTAAQLALEAQHLQALGELTAAEGAHLLYHNHYWEIEKNAVELQNLLDHTSPAQVSLAMDVGWVHRAGGRPAEMVQRFLDRIRYLHFKDFKVKDFANDTWTELGDGYVDFAGVADVIRGQDLWVTYERDETMPDAPASARQSRAFLKTLLG
jgi:inosose dehydratase